MGKILTELHKAEIGVQQRIHNALNDNFDHLLPKLKRHIEQLDESILNNRMRSMIEKILSERVS